MSYKIILSIVAFVIIGVSSVTNASNLSIQNTTPFKVKIVIGGQSAMIDAHGSTVMSGNFQGATATVTGGKDGKGNQITGGTCPIDDHKLNTHMATILKIRTSKLSYLAGSTRLKCEQISKSL
ncbi:MAG: hypothetical protein Q8S31_04345 [Alphaproteobacteria bacterium]|nr:hypothetical protein [Alphaproteobacteria bacterium]